MKNTEYKFDVLCLVCDNCGECHFIDKVESSETAQKLLNKGWVIRLIDNEWRDFCSEDCRNEFIYGSRQSR